MTYPYVPGYSAEQVKAYYDSGLPLPMPPSRPNPMKPERERLARRPMQHPPRPRRWWRRRRGRHRR